MKHLDEGEVQALLDGELPAAQRAEAEAHLASCPACTREAADLRSLREVLGRALPVGDLSPPVAAAQMALRARRARAAAWAGETRRALARAAVLALLVAGGASAAVPGVRTWVREVIQPAAPPAEPLPEAAPAVPAPGPAAPASGVSILPENGAVQVVLHGPARGLRVRARLQPGGRAEVAASGAAVGARFRTAPGRVEVSAAGPGEMLVVLPAEARAAVLEVDGRTVVAKEGERLRPMAGATATSHLEAEFQVGP